MIDYDALTAWSTLFGAIATTGAVIVALMLGIYPMRKSRQEAREKTETVRKQLIPLMDAIAELSSRLTQPQDEESRRYVEELKALFPVTGLLTSDEQHHIWQLYLGLCAKPGWPGAAGFWHQIDIADLATKASTILRQHVGFRPEPLIGIPWPRRRGR